MKRILAVLSAAIAIIVVGAVLLVTYNSPNISQGKDVYVGVTYCGNSVEEGKLLIDKVKSYTNLFVLQSGTLQRDFKSVVELGDYAVSAGMYFLPYFGNYVKEPFSAWLDSAKQRWGSHLLGVYYADEPAGKMLDDYVDFEKTATGDEISKTRYGDSVVEKPDGVVVHYEIGGIIHLYQPENPAAGSVAVYATFYPNGTVTPSDQVSSLPGAPTYEKLWASRPFKDVNEAAGRFYARDRDNIEFLSNSTKVFTSDYALNWFDYMAGYDVVLSQIGWNLTFSQQIALVRGAATLQNKDWGAVITWKYDSPPYLDSGPEILSQMRTAYECGAKYIILFNYYDNDGNQFGSLKEEHFQALESFWKDVLNNPQVVPGSIKADSVLVLPKNYAWGMRWIDDKIWGVFKADDQTQHLWDLTQTALASHDFKTDIVYEDENFPPTGKYQHIVQWD